MRLKEIVKNKLRILLEKKNGNYDYGIIMFKFNNIINQLKEIQSLIDKNDIYKENDKNYGLEDEPHITILYGLIDDEVDIDEFKEISKEIKKCDILLKKISIFENEEFDVLKFDITGKDKEKLSKINEKIKTFPHISTYPEYKPHLTIGYLKKGVGEKYVRKLSNNKTIKLKCDELIYSNSSNKETKFKLK